MKKRYTTYGILCKLPLGGSLWGLLFFFIFITACTEEAAETDPLLQQERYITVRMNIPGMTINASRAADGVIESVTALAFDSADKLLDIKTATNLTQSSFNLTIPNGTKTIHFLGNNTVSLPEVGSDISALTSLTTTDFNNLCYWGMATTSDGNTNPLEVTLYRNLAKISIKPSTTNPEFNDFTQDQLIISGLMNANRNGKLIPYKDGAFYSNQSGTAPGYLTLPDNPNPLNKTPEGNEGAGYGNWLYVFEHENLKDWNTGLYVICKIGNAYYKVALVNDNGEPYDIIRNHEYIIYVADVDDYSYDTAYRADTYDDAFNKKPINLDVEEVVLQDVTFSPTGLQTVQMGNTLSITMTVPDGTTLNNFKISADEFTFNQPNNTYEAGTAIFTFTPKNVGDYTITFTGSGEKLNPVNTTINVTVVEQIPEAGDEVVIWEEEDSAINIAEGYTLYDQNNLSEPNYFKVGAKVRVIFNYNFTEDWQKEQLILKLQTSADYTFAEIKYEEGKTSDILEYTIIENDLSASDTGWANNMYYAKLILKGSYVTITKIYIIPASTP